MSWVSTNPIFFQHYLLNTIFWLTQNFKVHFSLLLFSPSFWWHIKAESYKCILKYITYVYWNVFCKIFATYSRHMKTVNWKWILKYITHVYWKTFCSMFATYSSTHIRNIFTTYLSITYMYTGVQAIYRNASENPCGYTHAFAPYSRLHMYIQVLQRYSATPQKIILGMPAYARLEMQPSEVLTYAELVAQNPQV